MGTKGGLFRYADGKDKLLLLFGTVGSIGDGMMTPLTMYILSMVINELGTSDISISIEAVDKVPESDSLIWLYHIYIHFAEGMCWTRTAERQASRIRMECLKSVLRQEVGFFDNQTSSSSTFQVVTNITSDAHSIQDAVAEKIPNCLAHLTSFIGSILVAFLLSWRLALAALPFSLLFIVPGIVFGKVLKDLGAQGKDAYEAAGGIAEQAISSIRTVYSFVGEHQTLKRFSLALRKNMELGIKQGLTKGLLLGSMGMTYGAWAFQSWVGSVLVTERGENGGLVFVAGICTILGGVGIMSALPNLSFISQATTAATRIFEMIDRVPVINSEDEIGKTLAYLRGEIEFKDVDFSYPTRPDTPVLQRFNVLVEAGKTIGLVGSSGSGKSTVISLLERFYDPVKGNILLDGHKIKKLQLKWLRSQMGLVNQEPILFSTSIKENILIGKPGASMETVVKAAQAANVHDFIMKLNDGYETKVGQFGVQLSGGQKQRIAIARALIRDPKILLLDEATSALDAESERIVQEALDQASQGRTMIIIAHRLSTIRKADLIGVLQSGRVIESGSHDVLMQMNNGEGGAYSKMVQLQQSAMRNEVASGSYNPTKSKSHHSLMSAQTPHTPINEGSSYQNSPIYPLSPTFSISMTGSFQMHSVENQNDKNFHDNSHSPSTLLRLLRMSATEWKRTLLGCLGSAGSGAIYPSYAYCLGSVVSAYFIKDDSKLKSETRLYCLIFLGLAFLTLIANLIQHYNFAIMGEHLVQRVREKMLEKIFTFEIGWFDQDENTSAAICAQLANEAHLVRSFIADRMSLLIQVFFSASLAYTLSLLVTWRVAIVMIAVQPLNIGCFYSRSVLMKSMSEKAKKSQSEGSQLASEATTNHRTITAFSSQDRILDLFRETMKGPKKESIKQSWFSGIGLFSSQFLTTASITLTFWYAGRIMNQGLVSPKQLFQAFFLLMSTGKNIADAGSMTSDIAKGSSAIRTIFTILDRKSEIDPEDPKANEDIEEPTKGFIELKNVFFSYPSRPDQMIFKGLTLKIEAGKTVALVGQSGSGKSTIIGLIERFYDPQSGSVMVDERNIKSYNLRKLRSCIALVSQEPTLFAGTIRQNIVYGKEVATEAEIRKAAVLANAHEFISSTEDGYDTYCGERGVQLSGGQKQRIALARAVLKNPMILLLDEATSALDSASENLVQEALEKMMVGRTCVVVAHRLSTIQKADNIVVIKNGKVVEQGTQSSLLSMGNGGAYYSLIKMQASRSPYS
ncbi:ABC transporter B family member 15 [Citrus sinensis]|uniref:ABC transporter B family member 15 n=1 Tax=Citrus sinensis TaxID=2711 RepID=A0ACB8LHY2_CITSI|nr:ABC transporter B family member 15 [Citrus sinensis]